MTRPKGSRNKPKAPASIVEMADEWREVPAERLSELSGFPLEVPAAPIEPLAAFLPTRQQAEDLIASAKPLPTGDALKAASPLAPKPTATEILTAPELVSAYARAVLGCRENGRDRRCSHVVLARRHLAATAREMERVR